METERCKGCGDLVMRLDGVEDAQTLCGQQVPAEARAWAEENGLDVKQTEFAPAGRLFIIGALPVPWELHPVPPVPLARASDPGGYPLR